MKLTIVITCVICCILAAASVEARPAKKTKKNCFYLVRWHGMKIKCHDITENDKRKKNSQYNNIYLYISRNFYTFCKTTN